MRLTRATVALAELLLASCSRSGSDHSPPPPPPSTPSPPNPNPSPPTPTPADLTPNSFLSGGPATIIYGTTGGDVEDRDLSGQANFVRGFLAGATAIADTAVDPARPPARPMVYGGPHVNAYLAGFDLPFQMTADRLVIGGRTYQGDGIQLITVLPAAGVRPAMMILAGTGPLGVAEINARMEGANRPLLVVDRFGTIARGRWNGERAELGPDAPRIAWRAVDRRAAGGKVAVSFQFPAQVPATPDDDQVVAAGVRGIEHALGRLGIAEPSPLTFYVYPDVRSKQSITGTGGDGNAIPSARVLHVRRADTSPGGGMEGLIAHESTHVFTRAAWGATGSVLFGEGVAVWARGGYQGKTLDQWKPAVKRRPIVELLGPGGLRVPEPELYPLAGLVVEAVVRTVGLKHLPALYRATADQWAEACKAAGTTPDALEQALSAVLAP